MNPNRATKRGDGADGALRPTEESDNAFVSPAVPGQFIIFYTGHDGTIDAVLSEPDLENVYINVCRMSHINASPGQLLTRLL